MNILVDRAALHFAPPPTGTFQTHIMCVGALRPGGYRGFYSVWWAPRHDDDPWS